MSQPSTWLLGPKTLEIIQVLTLPLTSNIHSISKIYPFYFQNIFQTYSPLSTSFIITESIDTISYLELQELHMSLPASISASPQTILNTAAGWVFQEGKSDEVTSLLTTP